MRHRLLPFLAALTLVTVTATPAVTAASSTLVVDDDGADCPSAGFTAIQNAIDAASAGDTVEVCAGTYQETLYVNTPDITIAGAGPEEVTIDASGSNTRGITAEADGFTLTGVTVSGANDYGVKVEIGDETAIHDITLSNLVVKGSAESEVDLHGVEGAQLSNLVLRGQGTSGNGLAFTDSHDITVENLTTSGNNWGGVAFYTSGEFTGDASTTNITLTGYDDYTEANPVYLQGAEGTFQDIDTPAFPVHVEYHDAGAFASSFVFRQPNVTAGLDAAVSFFDPANATVLDTRDGSFHTVQGMSLDLAVDTAAPGADVVVHGGTYTEQVTVEKPLEIVAKDGATLTRDSAPGGIADNSFLVVKGAADVSLQGLTFQGPFPRSQTAGILVTGGASLQATDLDMNTMYTPGDDPDEPSGAQFHNAIVVGDQRFADAPSSGSLVLSNSTITGFGKSALTVTGPQSQAVVTNVTVVGSGELTESNDPAQDTFLLDADASLTLTDSTVRDVGYDVSFVAGNGVSLFGDADATVVGNTFEDVNRPVSVQAFRSFDNTPGPIDGLRYVDNEVTGAETALELFGANDEVVLRDSAVRGNTFADGRVGILVGDGAHVANVDITGNNFVGNDVAVENRDDTAIDVSRNWWDSPLGPTHPDNPASASGQTGGTIDGPAEFTPWCIRPDCGLLSNVPPVPVPAAPSP